MMTTMTRRGGFALGAMLAAATAWGMAAQAASPEEVARIANYKGADRQAMLEAGARKDGEFQIYTVGAQIKPLVEAFQKKYPYLTPKLFRAPTPQIAKRVFEEYKAGRHAVDVFELNDYGLMPLRDAGILAPYWTPQMAAYESESIEAGRHWVILRESYVSLGYNLKEVSDAEAPKTNQDLLNPKWKGKMGITGRGSTMINWVYTLTLSEGEDFVRKLASQNIQNYSIGGRGISNLVVSGEVPLSPTIFSAHMAASRLKGATVGWRALGPTFTNVSCNAIPTHSNAPHAAMLFIDFTLSQEGQKIYTHIGYSSTRKDMPDIAGPKKKLYLAVRPNFEQEYAAASKLAKEVFKTAKKR